MSARERLSLLDSRVIVSMPARAFRTAIALAEYLGDKDGGEVKVPALALVMKRSRRTAAMGLRELAALGIIDVQPRPGRVHLVNVRKPLRR